ncbi:MAG: thioredoxin family protein [Cyanomargarita calcarea GSE-NOS-MK-12-04C]|jgi:thioredoxin 1|uniref:Thioredoxin n=1 Tax=Cyanomargarita calcarea GSE-NOS-MK-12-04C TaxID=2839659 RepID=A0A951QTE4_9CYAN|nr:thioredoxin family protein [Cyanomargarita calcarea GSE-NOS-MK-12-04C]
MSIPEIQDSDFYILLSKQKLVVIAFLATWCRFCKHIAPYIEKLDRNYGAHVKIVTIDVDKNNKNKFILNEFCIKNIPTVLIFKDGELAASITGIASYDKLSSTVERFLYPKIFPNELPVRLSDSLN